MKLCWTFYKNNCSKYFSTYHNILFIETQGRSLDLTVGFIVPLSGAGQQAKKKAQSRGSLCWWPSPHPLVICQAVHKPKTGHRHKNEKGWVCVWANIKISCFLSFTERHYSPWECNGTQGIEEMHFPVWPIKQWVGAVFGMPFKWMAKQHLPHQNSWVV